LSSQEDYSKEPTTTARVEYDEATKQQALERAKLPETIPDDKILQQRQLEASYSRLRAPSPSAVAEVDKYISYIEEQKTAKKKLAQIESSLPELKTKAEVEAKYETEYLAKKELAIEEAWLSQKRQELIQRNLSAGKGSPEMYKSVEGSINALRQQNEATQKALSQAQSMEEYKRVAWQNLGTMYGQQAFEATASTEAKQAYGKFLQFQSAYQRAGGGKWDNTILGRAEYIYFGGSSEEYSKIVEADRRNIEASRRMSAGLRAQGNLQIQQAQQAELQRLGGTGQLTSGAGIGATKVSGTLTQGTNVEFRAPVALGTAQKAQDFAPSFLSTSEIQAKNQAYFESKGLGDYYKQQIASPVSNALNVDPRANLVGSLDSGFAQRQTITSTVPQVQRVQTQTPVSGLTVNQGIVASNLQARAQQKQQVKDIGNQKRTSTVITTGTVQSVLSTTPTTQANFVSGLDPRRYTDKSLMGTNVKATSTDPKTAQANIQQRQYSAELRAGNIGLATALLNPQTTQTYQVKGQTVTKEATSINAESYFQQLGYDTKKSDLIPDSVFKPVKFEEARLQASKAEKTGATMGDLTKLIPTSPQATPETVRQRKEAQIRVIKAGQPVITAPKEYNSDKTLIGTGVVNLVKKTQTTTVGASEEALTVPTEKKNVFEFDPIAVQVGKTQKYQFGEGETAKEFSTLAEAQSYARGLEPKVYEGNIFNKFLRTGEAIDLGEIDKARTPEQQVAEVVSRATMPIRNITYEVMNLARPEEEKIKIVNTGLGRAIGGTIEAGLTGQPLQSGLVEAYEYYAQKPIRLTELPAEALLAVAGDKGVRLAIQGGGKVGSSIVQKSSQYIIPKPMQTQLTVSQKIVSVVPKTANILEQGREKLLLINPLTRSRYKQVQEIANVVYPPELPRRIEKVGGGFLVTSGTESFPQAVPAITVRFGKKGEVSYFAETPKSIGRVEKIAITGTEKDLRLAGFEGIEKVKGKKFEFEVPATRENLLKVSDLMINQQVMKQTGIKVTEPLKQAKSDELFYWRRLTGGTQDTVFVESRMGKLTDQVGKLKQKKSSITLGDALKTEAPKIEEVTKPSKGLLEEIEKPFEKKTNEELKRKARESLGTAKSNYIIGTALIGSAYLETTPAVATPFTKPQLTTPTKSIEIPSTITNVRETPAVKISSGVIPLTATKTLTNTRQVVKEKLETAQVPKLETKISTAQIQRPVTITTTKLAVKQTAKLSLKQAQAFAKPTPTLQQFKRPVGGLFIPKIQLESQLKKKVKKGAKADFIGNVRLDSIYNVYKRRDITYGSKQVAKLEKQDKRVSKRVPNMLTSATSEMKKGGGKSKKKKSETILGFEFTKDKDEFNSFGSSLTGSKKGKKGKKGKKTKIRLI
jgi:hypothetical protein